MVTFIMTLPKHHPYNLTASLAEGLALAAVEAGKMTLRAARRKIRGRPVPHRIPGDETPLWNVLAEQVRLQLVTCPRGSHVQLARYLGVPKQRVTDYLRGRRRLPDAETTLRLIYWLSEKQAGRDPTL